MKSFIFIINFFYILFCTQKKTEIILHFTFLKYNSKKKQITCSDYTNPQATTHNSFKYSYKYFSFPNLTLRLFYSRFFCEKKGKFYKKHFYSITLHIKSF